MRARIITRTSVLLIVLLLLGGCSREDPEYQVGDVFVPGQGWLSSSAPEAQAVVEQQRHEELLDAECQAAGYRQHGMRTDLTQGCTNNRW